MSQLILPLPSPEATLERAGGKGANLALLARGGFRVPPGFIVTTGAYRAFAEGGLGAQAAALASGAAPDDPASLEAASDAIRALFREGRMPADIKAAMREAYAALPGDGPVAVAVRSSATAEDLPGLSFAGQQDTYLNVIGPEALVAAVQACWASLWTARAMAYRARNGVNAGDLALAVVVQVMVSSEVSGVLFTANPVTGHRGEMVIDAGYGLGEGLVSGQLEPDHYVVDRREIRVKSCKLGAKAVAVLPRGGGGVRSVAQDEPGRQALPDAQILELARTAARVEEAMGAPQDIEWAWAGGAIYILQSRPITSLYPMPESLPHPEKLHLLLSLNSVQGLVDPITPLGRDILTLLFTSLLRTIGVRRPVREAIIEAGDRLYVDETDLARGKRLRGVLLAVLDNAEPGAREALLQLIDEGRVPVNTHGSRLQLLRWLKGVRPVLAGALLTWLRPEARRRHAVVQAKRFVTEAGKAADGAATLTELLDAVDRYYTQGFQAVMWAIGPALVPGLVCQVLVSRWLSAWTDAEPDAMPRLLRGLPGNPTTQMDLQLWAAAESITADEEAVAAMRGRSPEELTRAYLHGELPPTAQEAIGGFLATYGARAVAEIDLGRPRWREDPRSIMQSLCSYLEIGDPELAPDHLFAQAAAEAEALAEYYVAQVRQRKGALPVRLLQAAIRRMRLLSGLRELPKFLVIGLLGRLRAALLREGQALAAQGRLAQAEDIFFLPLETVRGVAAGKAADLKAIVARERASYERELGRRQIPRLLLSTGEAFYQGVGEDGGSGLAGDGVSPGTVEGRVRVVLDPRGARLEPGEILVCPATDPGWTPLFLSAGGLVMELGGMMTHGAVVAREYGIPAVVGVHEVTRRLKTGQLVRVDGSAGRVIILDEDKEAGELT